MLPRGRRCKQVYTLAEPDRRARRRHLDLSTRAGPPRNFTRPTLGLAVSTWRPCCRAPSPDCYPWRAALPCAILKPQVTTAGRRDRTGCLCHRGSDDVCRRGNRCANPIYCHAASGIASPKRIESLSPFARRSQAPRFRTVLARFAPVRTSRPVPEVAPAGSGAARNGFAVLHSRFGPAGARAS